MTPTRTAAEVLARRRLELPEGPMVLEASAIGLCRSCWAQGPTEELDPGHPLLARATAELEAFFAGEGRPSALPLDFSSGTPFQQRIWRTLAESIGPGQLVSYGELATLAGRPGAARAVGSAMRANPLPIFVPCHRVIGAGGAPGGFNGGLPLKRRLLRREGVELPRS